MVIIPNLTLDGVNKLQGNMADAAIATAAGAAASYDVQCGEKFGLDGLLSSSCLASKCLIHKTLDYHTLFSRPQHAFPGGSVYKRNDDGGGVGHRVLPGLRADSLHLGASM